MPTDFTTAKEVAQDLLDKTGAGLLSGNHIGLLPLFILPQELETFEGRRIITTEAEMSAVFEAVSDHLRNLGVTDFVRNSLHADFKGPDQIQSMHETRLVARGQLVQTPYPVLTRLERVEGVWKVAHSVYAIPDSPQHSRALLDSRPRV